METYQIIVWILSTTIIAVASFVFGATIMLGIIKEQAATGLMELGGGFYAVKKITANISIVNNG